MKNVPKLRFNGFSDEWEEKKLGDCIKYVSSGKTKVKADNGNYKVFGSTGVIGYTNEADYNGEHILIARVGANAGYINKINEVCGISDNTLVLKCDDNLNYEFLSYKLDEFNLSRLIFGSGQPLITGGQIKDLKFKLPKIKEQEKIANFLTKIDKLIEKQDEKISNLEQYKKGMMQKIFSQEIRFKKDDEGEYPEWKKKHLGDIVERVVRKNKGNITKRPLTISAQYGLVDQEEFFNKVVASSNLEGYYLLNKGEFAYNKSYSNGYPFGAIKRLDRYENGAVSTLYICFIPKEHINSDYLVQYFESGMWHKEVSMVAVEGARNHGLLNISVSDFFETIHKVPCLDEQIKIAKFLSKIDSIVEKEKEKLEELRVWKKGLLQGMFI